jgi:diguanylate cyclase (GGDEF)-like protein
MSTMRDGGWVVTNDAITERQAAQAKLAHMALHGTLTNLPNRRYFEEHLDTRFSHPERNRKFAVLCFDLDRLKSANDALGHAFGDKPLRQVGERVHGCLRSGDVLARLGGDEFAILQSGVKHITEFDALAYRLNEVLAAPLDLDGQQAPIGVSFGIAEGPGDATQPDQPRCPICRASDKVRR